MGSDVKFNSLAAPAIIAAALLCLLTAAPVQAADPIFPTGSLIGLVPPPGMTASKTFTGFVDLDKDSAILMAAEPAEALAEIEKSLSAEALKKQNITVDKREDFQLSFGTGTLVSGKQEDDKKHYRKWLLVAPAKDATALVNVQIPEQEAAYPDAAVRAALTTLAIRASVPDAERLGQLPFIVSDLAGFHIQNVLPGRALMLIDAPAGAPSDGFQPHMFIAAFPGGPAEPDGRAEFARLVFDQIVGIDNIHITMSEPLRIGGQPGFQTVAQAKDAHTGSDVMVAQWLRFGSGGFLQMIGIAKSDNWTDVLTRMRTVRDGVDPK
jgi:hypothetical protein